MIRRHVNSRSIAIRKHCDDIIDPEVEHSTRIHGNSVSSSIWRLNDDNALVVHMNHDWVSMLLEEHLCIDVVPPTAGDNQLSALIGHATQKMVVRVAEIPVFDH